ncbi:MULTISPECIES: hypothetical protein [unclassified Acinetobacter]|uniref:hypothetical protein n=1 Tax=Acinetobacter TaxID=469 RepID=UPI0015D1DC5F|nr:MULTISPECIES: hypothetical protein [unclassified Acinetobacter]
MSCKYCGGTTLFGQCQHSNCGARQQKQNKAKIEKSTNGWLILIGIALFLAVLQWIINTIGSFFK